MDKSSQAPSARRARPEDIDRLVAIHTAAFPDARGYETRVRNFAQNPLGGLDDLWVLEERGVLLAHAFLFRLEGWFGGRRVPVGGIATLGVAPEARGRGVGSALLASLHEVAARRGDAITLLYPFRQRFYARLGYARVTPHVRLRIDPRAIPWRPEMRMRPATGDDAGAMASIWDTACARGTGGLARTRAVWDARLVDERKTWLVVEDEGGSLAGYVAWTLSPRRPGGRTALVVHEMAALSEPTTRSLWGAVGLQRDQASLVLASVPADDWMLCAALDGGATRAGPSAVKHEIGRMQDGPMVRILDVATALAARGWPHAGEVVLGLEGQRLSLVAHGGRGVVTPVQSEADVSLDGATLAAVAFGGLPPAQASALGRLNARSPSALACASAFFASPPYFSPDAF